MFVSYLVLISSFPYIIALPRFLPDFHSSIGLCRWYSNITLTILDIIHRPVFYLKYDVSETGVCPRLQVEPTQSSRNQTETNAILTAFRDFLQSLQANDMTVLPSIRTLTNHLIIRRNRVPDIDSHVKQRGGGNRCRRWRARSVRVLQPHNICKESARSPSAAPPSHTSCCFLKSPALREHGGQTSYWAVLV
jgi:hypothetical protein